MQGSAVVYLCMCGRAGICEILTKYLRINGENFDCFLCTAQTRIKLADTFYVYLFCIYQAH